MEEILASIRRIIADDQSAKTQQEAGADDLSPVDDEPAGDADDILDLAQIDDSAAKPIAHDLDDIDFRDPPQRVEPPVPVAQAPAEPEADLPIMHTAKPSLPLAAEKPLLAPSTDAVVSAAFGSLANTVISSNARTLDDLVQDMLRPMLKAWLDDNLPAVVERLVRAEIERVARSGRG